MAEKSNTVASDVLEGSGWVVPQLEGLSAMDKVNAIFSTSLRADAYDVGFNNLSLTH
jgi:hypothetical protein